MGERRRRSAIGGCWHGRTLPATGKGETPWQTRSREKLSEIDWEQDLDFEEDTTTIHDSVYVSFMGPFDSPRIVDIDSDRETMVIRAREYVDDGEIGVVGTGCLRSWCKVSAPRAR